MHHYVCVDILVNCHFISLVSEYYRLAKEEPRMDTEFSTNNRCNKYLNGPRMIPAPNASEHERTYRVGVCFYLALSQIGGRLKESDFGIEVCHQL